MATSKPTKKAPAKKKAEDDEIRVRVKWRGVTQTIRVGSMTGVDEQDFHRATGMTFGDIFVAGRLTTWGIAGLLWIHNRKREPDLTYAAVASTFTFVDLADVRILGDDETAPAGAGDGDPPRSAEPSDG